jgi:NAD(P)-dependent dehydrogenase (short-subunit alcohol dehydrogenase family)
MGKTLLITGAGSGIGRATAVRAAEDGYDVVLVGRRKGPLNQTLALLKEGAHSVLPCDVADRLAFRLGLRQVLGEPGFCDSPLVAVFANAGIGGSNEYAEDAGEDRWDEILRVNVTGVYVTLNECKPYLMSCGQERTHAVATSSVLARFGVPNQSAYVTSKTAVLGLVRSLAAEWGRDGILINALCPGWVETEMARESIQRMADAQGLTYDECHAQQCAVLPTGRMSAPEDMADAVMWMISENQKGMTGQGVDVNNGSWMS